MLLRRQMLSLMEAQSHFFQHGHQSLSELDQYRQKLSEEAGLRFSFPSSSQNTRELERPNRRSGGGLGVVSPEREPVSTLGS